MTIDLVVQRAQEYLNNLGVAGWLLYDYLGMNPVFWDIIGPIPNVTRPCWFWIPSQGEPRFLVSYVDQGRFSHLGIKTTLFNGRTNMNEQLKSLLCDVRTVAMEYSPKAELPRMSRVDAGTLELVRSFGVDVVSSSDTFQYAVQRWNRAQLDSHLVAARKLDDIVQQAFSYIGQSLPLGISEFDVAEFIRQQFIDKGMVVTDGPVVAVNEHSSDPHFDPSPDDLRLIMPGDWVLIDLWSRLEGKDTMFADITWTAYVGTNVPELYQRVFDSVIGARDAALAEMQKTFAAGRILQGWQVDAVARNYISEAGYGEYFNHRLGHSLGREVHGNAVNLDGWETHDTRHLLPGVAVTIEPGIYLTEVGVRSEINVYLSEDGPQVTTNLQNSVVMITE